MVDAVQFTVCGGINRCSASNCVRKNDHDAYCVSLVKKLEELRIAVDCPKRNLFGGFTGETNLHGSNFPEIICSHPPTSRDSGALFARYMTLFERVTAMAQDNGIDRIHTRCTE